MKKNQADHEWMYDSSSVQPECLHQTSWQFLKKLSALKLKTTEQKYFGDSEILRENFYIKHMGTL